MIAAIRAWFYRSRLTPAERECCHMSDWERWGTRRDATQLAGWRKEFAEIAHEEAGAHCRGCPAVRERGLLS